MKPHWYDENDLDLRNVRSESETLLKSLTRNYTVYQATKQQLINTFGPHASTEFADNLWVQNFDSVLEQLYSKFIEYYEIKQKKDARA